MEIYFACRAYQSCTFTDYRNNFRNDRGNNRRYRPGIRRFCPWPALHVGYIWSVVRDVAHGWWALDIVVYNKTAGSTGNHLGVYLGRNALTFRAGLGTGNNLAIFRLLVFLFSLAEALMVACDIGHIMRPCVPKYPAHYRSNFHSINHISVLRSSSSSGLSFRIAFPRCEMAFFSWLLN